MTQNLALDDDEKGQPLNPKNFYRKSAADSSMPTAATIKYAGKKLRNNKIDCEEKQLTGKLTVFQKLCFAVGGLPYQMTSNCLGFFSAYFYLRDRRSEARGLDGHFIGW